MFKALTAKRASTLYQIVMGMILFLLPWQSIFIYGERVINGAKWEWGTLGFYAVEALVWLAVFLFITWFWRSASDRIMGTDFHLSRDRMFVIAVLVFVTCVLLSQLWAPVGDVARQHGLRIFSAILFFFMLHIGPLSFERGAVWFLSGTLVQSLFGLWQFFLQTTFSSTLLGLSAHPVFQGGTIVVEGGGRFLRAYGAFPHPNIFGGYLVVALFVLFLFVKKKKTLPLYQWLCAMALCSMISAALFVTFSRSAWIAALLLIFGGMYLGWKRKEIYVVKLAVVTLITLVACTIVYAPLVGHRLFGGGATEVRSTTERVSGYREALSLYGGHMVLGTGVGNYTAATYLQDQSLAGWQLQPVHNVPLLMLVELGFVGVVFFFYLISQFLIFYKSTKPTKEHQWQVIGWIIVMAPLLLVDHYLWSTFAGLLLLFGSFAWVLRERGN